jgi:hypothetical protein
MSVARVVPLLLAVALTGCASGRHQATQATHATRPPVTTTSARPLPRAAVVAIPSGTGALAAMAPSRGLTLRTRPHGRVIAHLNAVTSWGSPTVVWAVTHRGPWLGVVATSLPNNQIGWLDVRHDRPRMWRSNLSLRADLSARTLQLLRGSRVVRTMPVAIGAPSTPTPTGRFILTDKLIPDRSVSFYGCCLLALSGHQPHLRPGWAGGNRIAIHGGGSLGTAASAGCLHARDSDLRRLMRILPLGTPVVIQN